MNRISRLLILVGTILLSACAVPGDLEVHQAWVRPTAAGENAAAYLTIHNHSADPEELIGASANVADVIEIHEGSLEDAVMTMNRIDSVTIDAEEEILFAPGGLHLMLVSIKEELTLGDHIGLILHFKDHEDIIVEVHVENTLPEEDHDH